MARAGFSSDVRALTSAASRMTSGGSPRSDSGASAGWTYSQGWQTPAWDFRDTVGELHYAAGFIANAFSRVLLTVGIKDVDGRVGPAFDGEGRALIPGAEEAMSHISALRSQIGGQAQLMRSIGENMFVAGEFHLLGQDDPATGARFWEALSTQELRPKSGLRRLDDGESVMDYMRYETPNSRGIEIRGDEVDVIRVWQQHPRWSLLADSSVRGVLDTLEEIQLLTLQVKADARSRIAQAKVFAVPEEIEYVSNDPLAPIDGELGDPLTRDLIRVFATPITDPGSAAAVVPFILRAPGELIGQIQDFDLSSTKLSERNEAKRQLAVLRLARGLELPVEIITGHASVTFSNAWQIDESMYKNHLEPKISLTCDALTVGYLWPLMRGNTDFVVWFDASELIAHPNREQVAEAAYGTAYAPNFGISHAAYRRVLQFSDGDAPSDDEIEERIMYSQRLRERVTLHTLNELLQETATRALEPPGPLPTAVGEGDQLQAAVEVSIRRAVQRAGARVRSRLNGNQPLRDLVRNVPDEFVCRTLGRGRVETIPGCDLQHILDREFRSLTVYALERGWEPPQLPQLVMETERRLYGATAEPLLDLLTP